MTTSAEVARMLRDLRRRVRVRPSLLASRVQSALGASSIQAAVEMLIDSALRHAPPSEAPHLRAIIEHEYASETATHKAFAEQLGMSERSYYRRRQEALTLLQREIETLLATKETPDAMEPLLAMIADYDPGSSLNTDARLRALSGQSGGDATLGSAFRGDLEEVRKALDESTTTGSGSDEEFWREEARFISGRCSGVFDDMETAAQRMQRFLPSLGKEYQIDTYLYLSELLMYRGDLRQATHYMNMASAVLQPHRSVRHRLTVLLRTAQLALMRGDDRAALEAASTVSTAARHHFDLKARGSVVLGRVRNVKPLPDVDWNAHGSTFFEVCFRSLNARQYLARGAYDEAWSTAQKAFHSAVGLGYGYLAARCAATLHLCLRATAAGERGPWVLEALRRHVRHGKNSYIGADLFDLGLADCSLNDHLLTQLADLYAETHPDCKLTGEADLLIAVLYHVAASGDAAPDQLTRDFSHALAPLSFDERKMLIQNLNELLETAAVLTKRSSRGESLRRWKQRLSRLADLANRELARRHGSALLR